MRPCHQNADNLTSHEHQFADPIPVLSAPDPQSPDNFAFCLVLDGPFIRAQFLMIVIALLILPATTTLALGEYPASAHSLNRAVRLRRWVLLAIKVVLVLLIVFFGTFDLTPIISRTGMQAHATLVGYILGLRWALVDQRRRCPVCLRLLSNPVRIGQPSNTFLEWYGVEFICARGHGLLHVPEMPTISYRTQSWLCLDASWRSLLR